MSGFLAVLGFALLPALGNFSGGLLAEFIRTSPRALSWALHAAAGIVIAVVAVEIMPEAIPKVPGWGLTVAFLLGGAFYMAVDRIVGRVQGAGGSGMWMIYFAVCMDLFSDGLLIGAGSAASSSLALVLALGQLLADVPEGFAAIVNFKGKDVPRTRRILLSASFAAPVLVAAILAYFLLRDRSETLQMAAIVFTAAPLVLAAVEDTITEAHESAEDSKISIVAFLGGFALFTFVSTSLG